MSSASAPTPMAIIVLVRMKSNSAAKNTKRQPMMMIAAWAGRPSGVDSGARIAPSNDMGQAPDEPQRLTFQRLMRPKAKR